MEIPHNHEPRLYCVHDDCADLPQLLSLLWDHRLPEELARHLFHGIVSGLQLAHAYGVVHRDIKLENLLLDATGTHRTHRSLPIPAAHTPRRPHCAGTHAPTPRVRTTPPPPPSASHRTPLPPPAHGAGTSAKIIDFGLAHLHRAAPRTPFGSSTFGSVATTARVGEAGAAEGAAGAGGGRYRPEQLTRVCGTLSYCPPEVLAGPLFTAAQLLHSHNPTLPTLHPPTTPLRCSRVGGMTATWQTSGRSASLSLERSPDSSRSNARALTTGGAFVVL